MKIVMITRQFIDISFGGVENHIFFLSEELVRAGHDVIVIRLGRGSVTREYLFDYKVIDMGRRPAQVFGQSGRRDYGQRLSAARLCGGGEYRQNGRSGASPAIAATKK